MENVQETQQVLMPPAQRKAQMEIAKHEVSVERDALLAIIERAATSPDIDIDKMQQMFALYQNVENDKARRAFAEALADMQAELPAIETKGRAYNNSKYAKYEDVVDGIRPALKNYGFSFFHNTNQNGAQITVTARLAHRMGHTEETSLTVGADTSGSKNSIQAIGSAISYAKRYTLCALLGIASKDEDNDGQSDGAKVSKKQAEVIANLLLKASDEVNDWFDKKYGQPADVPMTQFDTLTASLRKRTVEKSDD